MSQNEETITVLPSQPATTVQLEMAALQITSRTKQVRISSSGSKAITFLEVSEEAQMFTIITIAEIGRRRCTSGASLSSMTAYEFMW
jgi:hypothetical protein